MTIAFFVRTVKRDWLPKVEQILTAIHNRGGRLCCHTLLSKFLKENSAAANIPFEIFGDDKPLPQDIDILVSLGGDGTFLQGLQYVMNTNIPLTGINFGRMGFLTTADDISLDEWADCLITRNFKQEKHSLLEVKSDVLRNSPQYALNDICLQHQGSNMIEVSVQLDGREIPTYRGDGLIVATPTGSTAYSLSVGGPIVFPESKVLLLSPIAPHNLNMRTIVIPDYYPLEVRVRTRGEKAVLCMDNRSMYIKTDSVLKIRKANFELTSLEFPYGNFIEVLREKLLWGFDRRNAKPING